jgi:hypothetical protein
MKRFVKGLIPTTIMAMAVSACGGGPDIDKAKADFENPSGSGKDKNAVIAANGKQSTAGDNSALTLAGGGVPGLGLTVEGKSSRLGKIAPAAIALRRVAPMVDQANRVKFPGRQIEPLRVSEGAGDCLVSTDFEQAQADFTAALMEGKEASFSATFKAGDLSACDSSLSGAMVMSMDMKLTQTAMLISIETSFDQVCDNNEGSCADGAMAQDAAIEFGGMGESVFGSVKMVSAWDLTATYTDEAGAKQSIASKGGIRLGYLGTQAGEEASLEYLNYVKDSSGSEVSYVLIIKANTMDGSASITIKCKDGELTCSFNDTTGEGMCSGNIDGETLMESWTAEEYDVVVESEDFKNG